MAASGPKACGGEVTEALARLEERTGRKLGATEKPLLLSVRSGAVQSMPGMMDTILNLGVSDETVDALGREAGNERFAWDSYRRFISMYGEVVEGIASHVFEDALAALKLEKGAEQDTDLTTEDLKELVARYKKLASDELGGEWSSDPVEQLRRAIDAVFKSWLNPRAEVYRKANNISADLGTAVNVQQMVFGNRGRDLGDRGAVHPEPVHRRQGAVRRVPHQRPGRGCRRRDPHPPAAAGGDGAGAPPRGVRRAAGHHEQDGAALPRHAGHGVHHRER